MYLVGSKYCMGGEVGVKVVSFGLGDIEGKQWGTDCKEGKEE